LRHGGLTDFHYCLSAVICDGGHLAGDWRFLDLNHVGGSKRENQASKSFNFQWVGEAIFDYL
jgi:hypothetical protein